MGFISSRISITDYLVTGDLEEPVIETVAEKLSSYAVSDIDGESKDKIIGWTSYADPFEPDFEGSAFVVGSHFLFSLRVDKKQISSKIIAKELRKAIKQKQIETERDFLNRGEKQAVKDKVMNTLWKRIPATPNVYHVIWNYEDKKIRFFSHQKSANDDFETLFTKTFHLNLIRLFPYTTALYLSNLSDSEKDFLNSLTPLSLV